MSNHKDHHTPIHGVHIQHALCGGYFVESSANVKGQITIIFAAFSTISEALAWIERNLSKETKNENVF